MPDSIRAGLVAVDAVQTAGSDGDDDDDEVNYMAVDVGRICFYLVEEARNP